MKASRKQQSRVIFCVEKAFSHDQQPWIQKENWVGATKDNSTTVAKCCAPKQAFSEDSSEPPHHSFIMASTSSVFATFSASIKSVGTACVMSGVGFYLHQRNFITKDGKRALALMSQQVTFPLYFFTKIIYCNQDWSDESCPDVTSTLSDTWMLLFWPIYMVGMGLLVGHFVAKFTQTPQHQKSSVLACVAFANNTALPITLLNVIHINFPSTSDLGRIDPTLFLSVYL